MGGVQEAEPGVGGGVTDDGGDIGGLQGCRGLEWGMGEEGKKRGTRRGC